LTPTRAITPNCSTIRFGSDSRPRAASSSNAKLDVIRVFCRRLKLDARKLRWLDVGCGRGDLLRVGAPFFAEAVGCDVSPEMLEACRDFSAHTQPTIDRIPWNDSEFDLVTAVCVFHHVAIPERASLVREMMRVLRPGALLCVIEHNPLNPETRLIVARSPIDANAKLLTARNAQGMLASAGAKLLGTQYFLYLPEGVYRHFGAIEQGLARIPLGGQYAVFVMRPTL
jgi:ubiquinone/menaquinone biosynthesis C-methylase UbiE